MTKLPANIRDLPLVDRAFMALKEAVKGAMEEHARSGHSVFVERDGKIVEITAEELRQRYPNYNRQDP